MDCLNGGSKTAGGYHWAYIDDDETIDKLSIYRNKERNTYGYVRKVICIETEHIYESKKEAKKIAGFGLDKCLLKDENSTAGGYHWAYADDTNRINLLKCFIGKPRYNLVPIICFETGEKYINYRQAGREKNIDFSLIRRALLNSKYTAGGYHWCTEKDYIEGFIPQEKDIINARKVVCIETSFTYDSITIAEKETGCTNICGCCMNHKLTTKGYHWCYIEDLEDYQKVDKKNYRLKRIMNIETCEVFEGLASVIDKYKNISKTTLWRALQDVSKTAGGYHWKYID